MGLHAIELGATLYVPATRDDLFEVVTGVKIPELRSVVVCLEDSVREDEVGLAMLNLSKLLQRLSVNPPAPGAKRPILLVRPRNVSLLREISLFQGLQQVRGFVLPKVRPGSIHHWMRSVPSKEHLILPTLESKEVFDTGEVRKLRHELSAVRDRVLCVRIGGNDLLQCIGVRRSRSRTAYAGPLGAIVTKIVTEFAPWGFEISAPVLEDFTNHDLLAEEVRRDMEYGLLTKTAIHPAQVPVIQTQYRVDPRELEEAEHILDPAAKAVFAEHGVMSEPATHRRWAERIKLRASTYGTLPDEEVSAVRAA